MRKLNAPFGVMSFKAAQSPQSVPEGKDAITCFVYEDGARKLWDKSEKEIADAVIDAMEMAIPGIRDAVEGYCAVRFPEANYLMEAGTCKINVTGGNRKMKELTYDVQSGIHRSAEEEWMPHVAMSPKFFEWHYITLPMTGANGHQYFMFICAFNFSSEIYKQVATEGHPEMIPEGMKIYSTMLHMCDYTTDLFKSGGGPVIVSADAAFDTENNALTLTNPEIKLDLNFRYKGDEVYIYCRSDVFECELKCTGGSRVLWMQDRPDKPGFIREGAEGDWSFYYSLPKLPYSG